MSETASKLQDYAYRIRRYALRMGEVQGQRAIEILDNAQQGALA